MSRRSLQVLALILSLLVTVIALIFPDVTGLLGPPSFTGVALVTWLFGGVVIAAGALGVLTPRRTTLAVGSVIAVLGPLFLLQSDTQVLGETLSLLTAVALLAAGAWFGELGMTGIGIAGILLASSAIVANHVREQGSAIGVLVVGLVMVGVAIVLARTVSEPTVPPVTTPPPPDTPPGL
jgi:MFS family permease